MNNRKGIFNNLEVNSCCAGRCSVDAAVPKLFGCWAKFVILSASAGQTTLCIEKNKKQQHAHHPARLYTDIAIDFICSETRLQCGWWNKFFCCIIFVAFGSMLDAVIRRVSCVWNSVSTLGFTISNLIRIVRKDKYFQTPKSNLITLWNLWKSY